MLMEDNLVVKQAKECGEAVTSKHRDINYYFTLITKFKLLILNEIASI